MDKEDPGPGEEKEGQDNDTRRKYTDLCMRQHTVGHFKNLRSYLTDRLHKAAERAEEIIILS